MKKQLCTFALGGLLALGLSAVTAAAQDAPPPADGAMQPEGSMQGPGGRHGMDPDEQLARMTKRYKLSADQQMQLKPILVDHQQQMMALHADNSMSRQDKMAKMQTMRQDHMQKVEAVLTPDQKTKFDSDMAKMDERRMDRMHGGGDAGAPDAPPPPPPQ